MRCLLRFSFGLTLEGVVLSYLATPSTIKLAPTTAELKSLDSAYGELIPREELGERDPFIAL
jgi:hypothetical protein